MQHPGNGREFLTSIILQCKRSDHMQTRPTLRMPRFVAKVAASNLPAALMGCLTSQMRWRQRSRMFDIEIAVDQIGLTRFQVFSKRIDLNRGSCRRPLPRKYRAGQSAMTRDRDDTGAGNSPTVSR
jgi:hypothetical protein